MARTLSPLLERCLRRANPNVATMVEVAARDQAAIVRRAPDQFLTLIGAGGNLVSLAPGGSADASPGGALQLAAADTQVVNQYTDTGIYNIPQEDGGDTLLHTVAWRLDPAFAGCILSSVTVLLHWTSILWTKRPNVKLQIYRARRTAGVVQRQTGTSLVESKLVQVSFTPLLPQPVLVRYIDVAPVLVGGFGDITFDLTNYRLQIDPTSEPPSGPDATGDLPEIYFSITTDQQGAGNLVEWRRDASSAQTIAGLGKFRELTWTRANASDPASVWTPSETGGAMTFRLKVRQYVASSVAVYQLSLPALPQASSIGRVVYKAGLPAGTSATLELSTAGTGGPWTLVNDGDLVAPAQLQYHMRLTLLSSADHNRSPLVSALGVEFRNRVDLSAETVVEHVASDVNVPWLEASIGEGHVTVVRTGRRDYHDAATELAVAGPDTQLEADIMLGTRHPAATRADLFLISRASVSNREPGPTGESLTLLSLTKTLKRKIPARVELINTSHVVSSATSTQVVLNSVPALLSGVSPAGNEYDGRNYYIRVRKSAVPGLETGNTFTITGNTGLDKLDFTGDSELPGVFAAGDEIEVHSGTYTQPALTWVDQDPADIWAEILTLHLGVPSSRIGLGDLGSTRRGGLPPRITDRAPGDAVTQSKLRVTLKITEAENGDELIDQLSFIMGGATVEIAGQIVFRQIYPLRDAAGRITVAPDPVAAIFDPRDYVGLQTPTGREQRLTVLACDYGVNTAGVAGAQASTTNAVDVDALAAYETQDVEGLGFGAVPSKIARWCYNVVDGGRLLADMLSQQVVFACSTGLRVWSWGLAEARPELTVGDSVVLVTNQYTDYDPAQQRAIRGYNAYPLTIVGTSDGGRRLRGFLQGLNGVAGVDMRGGPGTLLLNDAAQNALHDVAYAFTEDTVLLTWGAGAGVAHVWAAYRRVPQPGTDVDFAPVTAALSPLPDGATSYELPRPGDSEVMLVELQPLNADMTPGIKWRAAITATPEPPVPDYDDVETETLGTEWLQLTERGIRVLQVRAQIQLSNGVFSGWDVPTRGPGDPSVVKGGLLGANEYEQDVPLSSVKGRQSFIRFQWLLDNGKPAIPSPDFGFDAGRNPNILGAITNVGSVLNASGDSDVQSWKVVRGAWSRSVDGQFLSMDVSLPDNDGTAGQGANSTESYTVTAYNVAAVDQGSAGAADQTSQVYALYNGTSSGGGGGSPAATWAEVYVDGPAVNGSGTITIRARASAAPAGWTVKVFAADPYTGSYVDETASLSPVPSTVPTVLTTYLYEANDSRVASGPHSKRSGVGIRLELRDAGGLVQSTSNKTVYYDISTAL